MNAKATDGEVGAASVAASTEWDPEAEIKSSVGQQGLTQHQLYRILHVSMCMYQGLGRREPIFVQESDQYSSDKFLIPNHYKVGLNLLLMCVCVCTIAGPLWLMLCCHTSQDYVQSVLLPAGTMRDRVAKLAADIREDYGTSTPHLICVLKVWVALVTAPPSTAFL